MSLSLVIQRAPKHLLLKIRNTLVLPAVKWASQKALRRLKKSQTPAKGLTRLGRWPFVSPKLLDQFLMQLLRDRDPLFLRLLDDAENISPASLRVLAEMYGADYRGLYVSEDKTRAGLAVLQQEGWRASRSNALYFLLAAIKNGDLDLVESVLDAFPGYPLHSLPAAYKTGILRLAAGGDAQRYEHWRQLAAPSPLERLQIQDIDHRAGFAEPLPHAALGPALRAVVPASMQDELDRLILPFYAAEQDRLRWMDCRSDPAEKAGFLDDIRTHLQEGKPYSLIRLGDGESYAWKEKVSAEHAARREQVWWGEHLTPDHRAQVADDMLAAIADANRLGIPSLFRFTRDTHPGLGTYMQHVSIVGLVHVLDGLQALPGAARLYTEERIHQLCFDLPTIAELCAEASQVIIVSSLTKAAIETLLTPHLGTTPLIAIEVPTHTKTRGNDLFVASEVSLPFVYPQIADQIRAQTRPGTLVLVAGGSIGKVFCAAAQAQGGVALDVGAMVDYWAGLKTRSVADMA